MRLSIGLGLGDGRPLLPWAVTRLFQSGEAGVWLDPSDLSTMFQDAAGTTPVTAAGDPVGLIQDKSGNGRHASQSTADARPTYQTSGGLHWLQFDGSNDFLVTASIDFTGTDQMSVFTGSRKTSDAAIAILAELSTSANPGTFFITAPRDAGVDNYGTQVAGERDDGATLTSSVRVAGYAAPVTNVLTLISEMPIDKHILRVDGAQAGSSTQDLGVGTFGNFPLYIGMRGGASLPFNGNLYGLIARGKASNTSDIGQTESYLAEKSGVTL